MKTFSIWCSLVLATLNLCVAEVGAAEASGKFKIIALAEAGGHHIEFTKAARPLLKTCGDENGFQVDFITNTAPITATFLAQYRLVLQLDFVPYGWTPEAMAAFKAWIEEGRGGWVGLHHATLLGNFDGQPMWPWFSDFMGGIKFKDYIPGFASATVRVEDRTHPCMKGVPESFLIEKEEWYSWDRSPRADVHVLASVDESTYTPDSSVKMGDHPVIWTNPRMAARNVYIFMGHGPWLLEIKLSQPSCAIPFSGPPKPNTNEARNLRTLSLLLLDP